MQSVPWGYNETWWMWNQLFTHVFVSRFKCGVCQALYYKFGYMDRTLKVAFSEQFMFASCLQCHLHQWLLCASQQRQWLHYVDKIILSCASYLEPERWGYKSPTAQSNRRPTPVQSVQLYPWSAAPPSSPRCAFPVSALGTCCSVTTHSRRESCVLLVLCVRLLLAGDEGEWLGQSSVRERRACRQ